MRDISDLKIIAGAMKSQGLAATARIFDSLVDIAKLYETSHGLGHTMEFGNCPGCDALAELYNAIEGKDGNSKIIL